MKRRGLIAGVLVCTMLTSGVVFAKQAVETIRVTYDNIKILIDGKEYQPTDVNGNIVEPFIYNGTTYLPVRAIANAFDKEVDWEAQTSTVTLGSKNYDWLDQMGYVDYDTSGNGNTITAWPKDTHTYDGIKYDRGIKFLLQYDDYYQGAKQNNDGTWSSYQNVEYLLNNNYTSFKGKILCAQDRANNQNAIIKVYGDGNLLYTSPPISQGAKTTEFDIDISNYKILKINASIPNLVNTDHSGSSVGIVDARLSKK